MHSFSLILFVTIVSIVFGANPKAGHLKPFGFDGLSDSITELDREYPSASKLFTFFIPKSEPCLSRQVLTNDNHYSIWETNEQLEASVYGLSETKIQVESFRARQRERIQITFKDFLKRFPQEPMLFANTVPDILQKYLVVPKPLQCEAVLETFQSAILVIRGMSASPIMFNDDYDHFHCALRGNKRLTLVNTLKYPDVRKIVVPDRRQEQGPPINPDRIDFDEFPALANVEYHIANLTSGDCLFIPNNWVFQERSLDNSISVIYNINHRQALNVDMNEMKTCPEYDETFTLDQIDWSVDRRPKSFKDLIMNLVNSNTEGYDKWLELFSKHFSYDLASDSEASAIFEEFYGIIDMDGDGQVTPTEVEQISGAHQHHITDILYEIVKVINNKRKTSTPKSVRSEDETAEHLHLGNYKTDL